MVLELILVLLLEVTRVENEDELFVLVVLDRVVDEVLVLEVEIFVDEELLILDDELLTLDVERVELELFELDRDVVEARDVELDSLELDVEGRVDDEVLELETAVDERDEEVRRVLVVEMRVDELEGMLDVDETRVLLLDAAPSLYNSRRLPEIKS